jgi:hypothetical protein
VVKTGVLLEAMRAAPVGSYQHAVSLANARSGSSPIRTAPAEIRRVSESRISRLADAYPEFSAFGPDIEAVVTTEPTRDTA